MGTASLAPSIERARAELTMQQHAEAPSFFNGLLRREIEIERGRGDGIADEGLANLA